MSIHDKEVLTAVFVRVTSAFAAMFNLFALSADNASHSELHFYMMIYISYLLILHDRQSKL